MPFASRSAIILGLLLVPLVLHAREDTVWDLTKQIPVQLSVHQLTGVVPGAEGLRIQTTKDGYIGWRNIYTDRQIDVLTLALRSHFAVEGSLLWHTTDMEENDLRQMVFSIPASGDTKEIHLTPSDYKAWTGKVDRIALAFPAGTDVTVQQITFSFWNPLEKAVEAWKSFWTFDEFRIYSINFLWGPLLAMNPYARAKLFDSLPPQAWSADRLFYLVIGIAALTGLVRIFFSRRRRHAVSQAWTIFTVTCTCLWLLFDLRMGLEILHYAKTDMETYVNVPASERTLRTHEDLYTIIDEALPVLTRYDQFAIFAEPGSPAYNNLRYRAYPSIARREGQDLAGVQAWLIVHRPDLTLNPAMQIVDRNGSPLSASGAVTHIWPGHSFLFEIP